MEEGSLLSISRSSCIGAQRAVGKTLTGLSGTISYTRYLLLNSLDVTIISQLHLYLCYGYRNYQIIQISGKLQDLSEKCVEDIYNYYGDDMHMTLDEFKGEVTRWRHRWPITEDDPPQTLVETLDFADPELYPGIYVAVKTLLTYPVSTCVAERSFSSMKRLKTPLRNTMSEDRLSSLSVLHIHKHKELDVNEVISEFARRKNRRLALCL